MELNLKQIYSLYRTDKDDWHSYVTYAYEDLFKNIRHSTKKVLEIGIYNGGSLLMWKEYFSSAEIFGIDNDFCPQIMNRERITPIFKDAYNYETLDELPNDFDVIIDDGPHTLESMTFAATEYVNKLSQNGILIIEDFQDYNWTNVIKRLIPEGFRSQVLDFRKIKNRYDDILMVITRA